VPADLIGETLGQFRILAKLGQGGMGVVYRATDEKLRRTVALKVLPPGFAADPARRDRFLREARAAAAVNHANIAAVYDVAEADGRVYIAMELVEGESLRARLDRGALVVPEALKVARGICRGLAKAHERGLVHRDLKPDNVMVGEDLDVKILDFGLAKDVGLVHEGAIADAATLPQVTADGQVLGTPAYMSPEQAAGKAVDARSDVFAFGVVLYEMVTGVLPFTASTTMEVLIAIARDSPQPASARKSEVTPELEAVIDRCLAKAADARYTSARDLLVALESLGGVSQHSRGATTAAPPAPRARLRTWTAVAAIGALGVATAWVGSRLRGHGDAVTTAATPAPSAHVDGGHVGVAMTDHPPPKTSVPEAAAAYAKGLQDFRDGADSRGVQELGHAVALDPGLAAAHLRIALRHETDDAVKSYQAAHQLRAQLDERDQMMLHAAEPLYAPGGQQRDECIARLVEAEKRFPDDAEIPAYLSMWQMLGPNRDDALATIERALALDPGDAFVLAGLAELKADLGDEAGALAATQRCLAISPGATQCLEILALLHDGQGDCAAVLGDARRMIAIDPQGTRTRVGLATALTATGAPPEAVTEALKQAVETVPDPAQRAQQAATFRFEVAVLAGDFVLGATTLADVARTAAASPTPGGSEVPVSDWLHLLQETGDTRRAASVARDFLKRLPSYDDMYLRFNVQVQALQAEVAAGDITRQEAESRGRKALDEAVDLVHASGEPHRRFRRRVYSGYAMLLDDEQATRDLLGWFGEPVPVMAPALRLQDSGDVWWRWWRGFGKALAVTGDVDAALPLLEEATRRCDVIDPLESAEDTFDFIHDLYWLGFAREKKGDAAGACDAYRRVLGYWGRARPRSVTADGARAGMKGLGCGG
jgi:eukaryotic-like serine/threonine-protein kinase